MADYIAQKIRPEPKFFGQAYKGNLRAVLNSIKKYIEHYPKPVVITADHGEMLGEKGLYLHKENFPKWAEDKIRVVPWLVVE